MELTAVLCNSNRNCSEIVFNRAGIDTACRSRRIFLARTCLAFTGTRSLGLRVSEVSHRHRRGWIDRNGAWNLDADPRRPKESIVWRAVYRFLMMSLTASSQSRLIEKSGRDYIYIYFFFNLTYTRFEWNNRSPFGTSMVNHRVLLTKEFIVEACRKNFAQAKAIGETIRIRFSIRNQVIFVVYY